MRERIPTRYMYDQLKGDNFLDKQPHVKVKLWDNSAVRDIITDETYLGTMFLNRAKCGMDTNKKRVEQPKDKWIIVEDQHEALVSREIFQKANDNIAERDMSSRTTGRKNIFLSAAIVEKGLNSGAGKMTDIIAGAVYSR